jgi:hypothetical protein
MAAAESRRQLCVRLLYALIQFVEELAGFMNGRKIGARRVTRR